MELEPAPYYADVAGGPPEGDAWWVRTSDDLRIRVGRWRPDDGGTGGTVLLFPGRTEYIEKYHDTAREMARRGFATLAVDWRGQGLSDRLLEDRVVGHVDHFPDYQKDIAAMLRAARALDMPRPYSLLGHSMGGAIGLRAVMEGLAVQACAFTGPMWGIYMSPLMRPIGRAIALAGPALGLGRRFTPNTGPDFYVLTQDFEGNVLTNDPDMYRMLQTQLRAHPDLGIGGPSLIWLREALNECDTLAERASPDVPCITFLGAQEAIVDCDAIRRRMEGWPRGTLDVIPDAQHELLMERPAVRTHVFDRLATLFSRSHDGGGATT